MLIMCCTKAVLIVYVKFANILYQGQWYKSNIDLNIGLNHTSSNSTANEYELL